MKKFYLLLSMLSLAFYSSAAVVEINGIYYNLISKAKVAEVSVFMKRNFSGLFSTKL